MAKETLVSLYGGHSAEREVFISSAESIMRAINYDKFFVKTYSITQSGGLIKTQEFSSKPVDDEKLMTNATVVKSQKTKPSDICEEGAVIFPVLHGPTGEDSSAQGFLEILKMSCVGTNILSSSVATDKTSTKHVPEFASAPFVAYMTYVEGANLKKAVAEVNEKLTYPVFVRPANMGSSVGISRTNDEEGFHSAIGLAPKHDNRILTETGVNAREIGIGILGNADVQATLPGEVVKDVALYDYDAKYTDNKITMDTPARINSSTTGEMHGYTITAFRVIDGCGLSCCDSLLTKDDYVHLNELSTIPGFTQWSMYPLLRENMGLAYFDLIEKLVELVKRVSEEREGYLIQKRNCAPKVRR